MFQIYRKFRKTKICFCCRNNCSAGTLIKFSLQICTGNGQSQSRKFSKLSPAPINHPLASQVIDIDIIPRPCLCVCPPPFPSMLSACPPKTMSACLSPPPPSTVCMFVLIPNPIINLLVVSTLVVESEPQGA
jgi:hypothetical protein